MQMQDSPPVLNQAVLPPLEETFKNVKKLRIHISALDSRLFDRSLDIEGILINDTESDLVVPAAEYRKTALALTKDGCVSIPFSEEVNMGASWGSLFFFKRPDIRNSEWKRRVYVLGRGDCRDSSSITIPSGEARPFYFSMNLLESELPGSVKIRLGDGHLLPYSNEIELVVPISIKEH